MDRDQLKDWLDDGLSLEQIAALEDRHPSTVGYWVQKHGLVANGNARHAPRGGIAREALEPLVKCGATLHEMADELGRSISNVRYWIAKYRLTRTARRGRRPVVPRDRVEAALKDGRRTLSAACRRHGQTVFVIENSGRARCRRCRMERVAEWRRRTKATLVREAGGRCKLCGYNRCLAALQFHHRDPSTKRFALSLRGVTRSLAELREEAKKCDLLCANCHAEVEVGFSKSG